MRPSMECATVTHLPPCAGFLWQRVGVLLLRQSHKEAREVHKQPLASSMGFVGARTTTARRRSYRRRNRRNQSYLLAIRGRGRTSVTASPRPTIGSFTSLGVGVGGRGRRRRSVPALPRHRILPSLGERGRGKEEERAHPTAGSSLPWPACHSRSTPPRVRVCVAIALTVKD